MSISIEPKSIKALAIDLDGTILTPDTVLSERTIRALDACRKRGIQIILSTGRSLESTERFRSPLCAEGPMIYLNGAIVVNMPEDKVLNAVPLSTEAAEFCVNLSREMEVYCQLYVSNNLSSGRSTLMAEKDYPERDEYAKHTKLFAELGDLKEALRRAGPKSCIKCMFVIEPEIISVLRPRLEEGLGKGVYIARTLRTFLEVMDVKASKGEGLRFIMESNSWKPEEVIAIGDEENDLPMFDVAGLSLAPANAKDMVKAKADMVIGSNAEDGVAAFLEEFFGF